MAAAPAFTNRRILASALAVGAAGAALALSGCTSTVTGHPVAGGPTGKAAIPEVSVFGLEKLLLEPAVVDAAAHTSGMRVVKDRITKLWDDSAVVDNQRCLPVWSPGQAKAYAGTDWGVLRGQILKDGTAGKDADHSVVQIVVQFSKTEKASDFFADSSKSWSACDGQTITTTASDGRRQTWSLGDFTATDDTLTITQTLAGSAGGCQRALSVRANVSIDVMVCGADVRSEAGGVAAAIIDNIPRV